MCSGPFIPLERGGLPSVQWALHRSWERRFIKCAVGCGPLIPPERGGLPSVQWGPSSLLREKVYPVCSGPLISPEIGGLPSVQWAFIPLERRGLSSVQWPIISTWPCKMRFTQGAASPSSILRMRFGQCAVDPSSITRLKDEVHPVCGEPFPLPGWSLHNVQLSPSSPTLPYQVWPSDYQSDLDNRCVWSGYENEGCEQHEYSLWRHRFTDCSVEVTLRSDCLGRLNQLLIGQGGGGRWGVLNT